MTSRDPDLDHLTSLLGRCLGRIDEQAHRLQHLGEESADYEVAEQLEDEANALQELVGSLLAANNGAEETDVNRTVDRVAQSCLTEIGMPILLRQDLAPDLPVAACPPALVTFALQRAMVLAIGPMGPGGELRITTREDNGSVVVELESRGNEHDEQLPDRAETLRDFVDGFGGQCKLHRDEQNNLFVLIELPQVLATGDL